ncbi:MAG: hypothetical protein ACXAD7_23195, partial [Candidatus Kariarchaeaceae archaeon]
MVRSQIASKVLEDNSTLLQMELPENDSKNLRKAPIAILESIFAIQPSKDFTDASRNLFRVSSQPGVQIIRQIFPAPLANPKKYQQNTTFTGLFLLVKVTLKFQFRSENSFPAVLQEARKEFVKRRSMSYTILEASGFEVNLITGKKLIKVSIQGEKVSEGISVFRSVKGFHSKLIEPFLQLDRVPSRIIHDYPVQNLPVLHRIGTRIDNPAQPVGLPKIKYGTVLTCGSSNLDLIAVLQNLIVSFAKNQSTKQIFVIDSRNEMNGLVKFLQNNPSSLGNLNLQIFRLGTNIHLNICDVIVPLSPSGQKKDIKARASWKSHIISQILLSSLTTSDYLSQRYSIPLEAQIKNTAETKHNFTLKDVKLNIGGANVTDVQVEKEGVDMMFADMMAIDALAGILDHFRSFPEVNYVGFTGAYSNTLIREKTVTFFQFGAQPPLVRRATVAFLLHFLSRIEDGSVVLTHSEEFLSRKTASGRSRVVIPSSIIEACNKISQSNSLVLSTQSLQALSMNMDSFEEIKNSIYLKMVSVEDRDIVRSLHEILPENYPRKPFLGITDGEGLLFREDAPQNVGFHFKVDSQYIPTDLHLIEIAETKRRGSRTLGLTPTQFEILMKVLKLVLNRPCSRDDAMQVIENYKQGEILLDQFQPLNLWDVQPVSGISYWTINQNGRDFYATQQSELAKLPSPFDRNEALSVPRKLKELEDFNEGNSSKSDRLETNQNVRIIVGRLLNFLKHIKVTSIPWSRVADYYDLEIIDSLEWQDFKALFDLANELSNNIILEVKKILNESDSDNLAQALQTSSVSSAMKRGLDDYLPDDKFILLQKISREHNLETYPNTGILDLYFELYTKQRSLL